MITAFLSSNIDYFNVLVKIQKDEQQQTHFTETIINTSSNLNESVIETTDFIQKFINNF